MCDRASYALKGIEICTYMVHDFLHIFQKNKNALKNASTFEPYLRRLFDQSCCSKSRPDKKR
jgi:hypothetical protein